MNTDEKIYEILKAFILTSEAEFGWDDAKQEIKNLILDELRPFNISMDVLVANGNSLDAVIYMKTMAQNRIKDLSNE